MEPRVLQDRPLRVLYVSHTSARGGSSRSLRFLIKSFPRGSVDAYVLCPPGPAQKAFRDIGAEVITLPAVSMVLSEAGIPMRGIRWLLLLRSLWELPYGRILKETILKVKPDLLHLNERGMLQAALIGKHCGLPVIMHARTVADRASWLHRNVSRYFLSRYVDRVIAIDESVRRSLEAGPVCRVVYNPVELDEGPREWKDCPRDGRVHVLYLSGLLRHKGVWDLLESARILRYRKDIVFDIYGSNPRPDFFYRSLFGRLSILLGFAADLSREISTWVSREGLQETVRISGHVDAGHLVFSAADILVFPSHMNGAGRSVFEAGLWGIPSILTLRDRVEDIVVDGITGLIGPERDPQTLSRLILKLADDVDLRRSLGNNARERYPKQFSAELVASKVLESYRSVLRDRTSP